MRALEEIQWSKIFFRAQKVRTLLILHFQALPRFAEAHWITCIIIISHVLIYSYVLIRLVGLILLDGCFCICRTMMPQSYITPIPPPPPLSIPISSPFYLCVYADDVSKHSPTPLAAVNITSLPFCCNGTTLCMKNSGRMCS